MMKVLVLSFAVVLAPAIASGQVTDRVGSEIHHDLAPFKKIVASPRIHLVLEEGDQEGIRLVYDGISADKINVRVSGKTLYLFLDGARTFEKSRHRKKHRYFRTDMYKGVSVTAYVTYRSLESLEIRGDQKVTCHGEIKAGKFRLRSYGENDIRLASLTTDYLKVSLYGQNKVKIKEGQAIEQKYNLFGDNEVNTRDVQSNYTAVRIFGDGNMMINTREELMLSAFGSPTIHLDGGPAIDKRWVFGSAKIRTER